VNGAPTSLVAEPAVGVDLIRVRWAGGFGASFGGASASFSFSFSSGGKCATLGSLARGRIVWGHNCAEGVHSGRGHSERFSVAQDRQDRDGNAGWQDQDAVLLLPAALR
jgi:hypothetical protein